jgi:hypothetical protein
MDYKFLADGGFIQNKRPATAAALEKKLKVQSVVLPQGIIMTNRPHSMAHVLYTGTVRIGVEVFKLTIVFPKQLHIPRHVPLLIQNRIPSFSSSVLAFDSSFHALWTNLKAS